MPIWGILTVLNCSYKNLHQANTVSQYLNAYRTFISNTDWNMTRNLHFKKCLIDARWYTQMNSRAGPDGVGMPWSGSMQYSRQTAGSG